jgi:peptidoglycan/LPS O-acetylase OafA/YrhL
MEHNSTLPATDSRRYDLDALRAVAMLLGIVLHGSLAYTTAPFWADRLNIRFHISESLGSELQP